MSTLLSSFRGVKLAVLLALVASVFLAACGAQATAAPANTESPSSTAAPAAATDAVAPAETSAPAASQVSFSKDVLPILESRCVSCHGGEKTSKGLKMTSYEELMAGSQNGPVVVAGDANNSAMIKAILAGKMPKRGPKLLPEQVQVLIDWINGGALGN